MFLLDTHVLLWWLGGDPRLGPRARDLISNPESPIFVSAATAWEIAIKAGLARLDLGEPPEECLPREMDRAGFRWLDVSFRDALAVRTLPPHHGDPLDRLLVAQARIHGLTIITADGMFSPYGVPTVDAAK